MWVDYWDLGRRLNEAQQAEVEAFYERWSGSYVEDRLRNDWLLELGKRRDWPNFTRDPALPHERRPRGHLLCAAHAPPGRARTCAPRRGRVVRAARPGRRLPPAGHQRSTRRARSSADDLAGGPPVGRATARVPRAPRHAAAPGGVQGRSARCSTTRRAFLAPRARAAASARLALLALMRLAASDADEAAAQLERRLGAPPGRRTGGAGLGQPSASRRALSQRAHDHYLLAWRGSAGRPPAGWSDDTLAWGVRGALRGNPAGTRALGRGGAARSTP
jgi:soluble lytic murein transglycosylase